MDKLCIAANHKINIFNTYLLNETHFYNQFQMGITIFSIAYCLKTSTRPKTYSDKKFFVQYEAFRSSSFFFTRALLPSTVTLHNKYLWLTNRKATIISTCKKTMLRPLMVWTRILGRTQTQSQRNVFNILWNPCHKELL